MEYCNKQIIMVLEGETEVILYRHMIEYIYTSVIKHPIVPIHHINFILARGVGNIGARAVQTFKMNYHDPNMQYIVFCCFDTDVFESSRMPRLWTQHTVNKFLAAGAVRVHNIRARHMIEDWYFYDYEGILKFLNIPRHTVPKKASALPGANAVKKLNHLYKLSHKIYQKGYATDTLISHLNIAKIYDCVQSEFTQFIKEIESD